VDESHVDKDLTRTLLTEDQIQQRLGELARQIETDYDGLDLLLVGVL
jgi:hypoxanthine phosphoribosyltransferase